MKLPLSPILALYRSAERLNSNFDAIKEAFENTLSRDGTSPNNMSADIDMNGKRVINLGTPEDPNDAVRLSDVYGLISGDGEFVPTNLTFERTDTTLTVKSSTGTDAVLPGATPFCAGLLTAADKQKLDALELTSTTRKIPMSSITGLTIANDPLNINTHITIATGQCRDGSDTYDLKLLTSLTKRINATFAAGSGNGGLDTGTVAANTGYWVHLIRRSVDGGLDILFSTSATNPLLPSGYNAFRRIGSILTDASANIRKFIQHGDYFQLYDRTADFAGVANGSGPYLRQMVCPKGIPLLLRVYLQSVGLTNTAVGFSGVYDPALGPPQLATLKRAQIRRVVYKDKTNLDSNYGIFDGDVWCDSNGQVYTHSDDPGDQIALGLYGWTDDRSQIT